MFFDDEAYELSSDLEIDSLLADLPFNLVKESINEQIEDPLSTSIDYVNTIVEKCDILKEDFEDNQEAIDEINSSLGDFFNYIIKQMSDTFDFTIDAEDEDISSLVAMGEALYNFLVLKYKKNITRFIYKYIIKNKKILVEQFSKLAKSKDVTSISLKKQIKNKDDVLILSNLPNVIKHIIHLDIEPIDFLKYACDDEYYEGTIIKQMLLNGKIVGNFITNYFDPITDSHNDILDEIQTEVKLKLMKKIM